VVFENEQGQPLLATSSEWVEEEVGRFGPGDEVVFSVTLDMAFAPGRIYASPWVVHHGGTPVMDRRPRMASAVVTGAHVTGGLVDLPHDVRLASTDKVLQASSQVGQR